MKLKKPVNLIDLQAFLQSLAITILSLLHNLHSLHL